MSFKSLYGILQFLQSCKVQWKYKLGYFIIKLFLLQNAKDITI